MKIINLYNHKGGVGKTTLSVHLANKLQEHGNTLLIELDDQANILINLNIQDEVQEAIDNAKLYPLGVLPLMKNLPVENFIFKREGTFDIIVNNELNSLEASIQGTPKNEKSIFTILFENIKKSGNYDYIVVDNPPSKYDLVMDCLKNSTNILIPFDCEDAGTKAVIDTLNLFANIGIDFENFQGIIPNKYLYFHKALHDENILTIKEAITFEGSTIKLYDTIKNLNMYKNVTRKDEYKTLMDDVLEDIIKN